MRYPRFTIRRMMIGVSIVGFVCAIERMTARFAINIVSDRGDGEGYILHEAIEVWVALNILIVAALLCPLARTPGCARPISQALA